MTTPCGKKISQTTAIIRYVANELNLFGKSNVQRAVIDSTIVCNKEIGDIMPGIKFSPSEKNTVRLVLLNVKDNKKILFLSFLSFFLSLNIFFFLITGRIKGEIKCNADKIL